MTAQQIAELKRLRKKQEKKAAKREKKDAKKVGEAPPRNICPTTCLQRAWLPQARCTLPSVGADGWSTGR